jgi:hypothetical protein
VNSKSHENLKIRLYYDDIKKVQAKHKVNKSRKLRGKGEQMLKDLALSDDEIENIFDILEEDLPEL